MVINEIVRPSFALSAAKSFGAHYIKRLFLNAIPEPDLRYRSKSYAFSLLEKVETWINSIGNLSFVKDTSPFAWAFKRCFKLAENPV